jgi:alpha-1,4-digalacturonate transport system substrate-binding protein
MPGGAFLVPYKSTKHPQEVARVMDYLASEPVYAEYHARTLFLTASAGLAEKGVAYKADLPQLQKSLAAAAENAKQLAPLAYKLQGYRYNRILFNTMIVRINQAIAGEMSLDDALARMNQDVVEGLKAQGVK